MSSITSMKFSNARIEVNDIFEPSGFCRRLPRRLVKQERQEHERHDVETRRDEERIAKPDDRREHAANDRTERRPHPLRRLHGANRRRHLVARRRQRRHRQRQRAVAGEEPLDRAQGEEVPGAGHVGHRDHHGMKLTSER